MHAAPARDGLLVYMRDVTHRALAQQELNRLAFHDPLTGLPNRALFLDRLKQALARADRDEQPVAVLFLDLDNSRSSTTASVMRGRSVARSRSPTGSATCAPSDTVARLGGDEFTVLVEDAATMAGSKLAERMADTLRVAIMLHGREVVHPAPASASP